MRSRVRSVAVGAVAVALLAIAGCADGPPPLDEMPLRDALRADPEVVAALPASARATLARRLEHARVTDATSDAIGDLTGPGAMVGAIDNAREHRRGDPLVVGAVAGGVARPVSDAQTPADPATVPPVEGGAAATGSASAALEARALAGETGATLRALLAASGAHRLVRVSGWPIGAVAIGDAVYVDAAWLVALAGDDGEPDAGADASSLRAPAPDVSPRATSPALGAPTRPTGPPFGNVAPAASAGAAEAAVRALIAAAQSNPVIAAEEARVTAAITYSDGGVSEPPPPPEPAASASCGDTCVAAADACGSDNSSCDSGGDSCDDGSNDSSSCDSTSSDGSSSCDSTSGDGSDSCSGGTDDGSASCNGGSADGTGCQVAGGGRRPRGKRHGRLALLCAPLAFLWPRRGR